MSSSAAPRPPVFSALSRDECLALLNRHAVGRIAYAFHDRVDIQPVHYVQSEGWLYGRTSEGSKLDTIAHNRWVAFEVDEVRGTFDWASAVVHGAFYRLDPEAPAQAEREHAARAAALLENVVPNTLSLGDPVPFRTVLFRVHVDEVTGRRAVPGR
jgi:nitroimidazol reductase NimA-like FMN-containing flavoprotein (pyridoxamine 5'-phosphate oxidase superfamily)